MNSVRIRVNGGSHSIVYREVGAGEPLLFLHGGWGYSIYPFDAQIDSLSDRFRIVIPDRTGYGRSSRPGYWGPGFHEHAARETFALMDALGIDSASLWGHSDGAVFGARMALADPARVRRLVLEAIHLDRAKLRSRGFFTTMASNPLRFGEKSCSLLAAEHGDPYWQEMLRLEGEAWLDIAARADDPSADLYSGRLNELAVPTLVLHGSDDPRTEPDELERLAALLPSARIHILPGGGHSPHSEPATMDEATRLAVRFLTP